MVIMMITLASGILIALTDSTYVAMRLNRSSEQRVKAEYVLKSVINVAQMLIKLDRTQYDDPQQDAWMQFQEGATVPGELVGISEPNVKISLLISPESGKIPLLSLVSPTAPDSGWRDVLVALYRNLGFENQGNTQKEQDAIGVEQMVANLIDYLDFDKESYSAGDFSAEGIEGSLPSGIEFRNDGKLESVANELSILPGYSDGRIQCILPFVSIRSKSAININAASLDVLQALIQGLAPSASGGEAAQLIQCRSPENGGPFNQSYGSQISACIEADVASKIRPRLVAQGDEFFVIAKVEYGSSAFMASAHLKARNGRAPAIEDLLVY
jgi:type II secretory pathway component PulK